MRDSKHGSTAMTPRSLTGFVARGTAVVCTAGFLVSAHPAGALISVWDNPLPAGGRRSARPIDRSTSGLTDANTYAADPNPRGPSRVSVCICNTPGFCETTDGARCSNLTCIYPAAVGQPCNDGNPNTINDACTKSKQCVGTPVPAPTTPALTALPTLPPMPTATPTPPPTTTHTVTPTLTHSPSAARTGTATQTLTLTPTVTSTFTTVPTVTQIQTATASPTPSPTVSPTSPPTAPSTPTPSNASTASVRLTSTPSQTATRTPAPCVGDCTGDGQVTVNELIEMVNIALGVADVATCITGDVAGDGVITVNEIVAAVHAALNGCWQAEG